MLEDFRLRVFVTVAECGSFTKAAHNLGISQPAASQNISSLESETGTRLFDRTHGAIELTDKGRLFLEYARKILFWYSRIDGDVVRGETDGRYVARLGLDDGSTACVSVDGNELHIHIDR